MSSFNFIEDNTSQSSFEFESQLNQALEELELIYAKMPTPHKAQYSYLCPGPQQLIPGRASSQMKLLPMDLTTRLRATKVFNVILARLWRRRCAEVSDLHELVRKYQQKANQMRDDLFLHYKMTNREQQRNSRLESEFRQYKRDVLARSHNCETIDKALNQSQLQEEKLRLELKTKTLECNNLTDLLNETKSEMFRELGKFRKCAKELAEQQRQNRQLEIQNADLEDQILTLKDEFQAQHDNVVLSVHMKQEKLDEAYETLKGYEQELAVLELKHNELLKNNQIDIMQQELNRLQHKNGIIRYLMGIQWPKFMSLDLVAKYVAYIVQNQMSRPTIPKTSMGYCLAIMLLIGVIY